MLGPRGLAVRSSSPQASGQVWGLRPESIRAGSEQPPDCICIEVKEVVSPD